MRNEILSETEFIRQVADAYGHLYDLVYLRTHPLINALIPLPSLSRKEKALQLHRILLDVIEELQPGPQVPILSRQWRRHRLMVLRYVKALDSRDVADQLTISRRHYYREHKIAIEALADILWERYVVHGYQSQQVSESVQEQASLSQMELLRTEAARIAQANRYAPVGGIVRELLPLLQQMLEQHEISVDLGLSKSLPGISVDRSLLRQMLLGLMGYLVECAVQATIRITAQVEESVVHMSMRVKPPTAVRSRAQVEIEKKLMMFEEIATLGDTRVVPMRAGQCIVGFDVELPIAQRTILVVDDNQDVVALFQRYLNSHHYRIITAQTAEKALEQARHLQPYAITLDLMMPNQDGWDLLQTLLNQPDTQHIPIIVCTVLKQKALALSLGAAAFLEKPVTEQELLSALRALEET
jgi:CheY-like chemotaxis protein